MSCEICSLDSIVDTVMWTCVGCSRAFHAACVGVTVLRGSIRKRDKKIDPQSYVLPCCSSCQTLVALNFDVKSLTEQQTILADSINNNTQVVHRSTQQNNMEILHEAIDRLEGQLSEIKKELMGTKSTGSSGNLTAIKNHITSVFDIAMQASKETISTSFQTMTSDMSVDLKCLNEEIKQLSSLLMDTNSSAPMHSNPMLQLDILDELKSISANIVHFHNAPLTPSVSSCPSLEIEIQNKNTIHADDSGWRLLGNKRVWKADWADYDARKLHRLNQQKKADKAKKRKKQRKSNAHFNHSHSRNHPNQNIINYRMDHHQTEYFNRQNEHNRLPHDRDLLAAAKDRFSRPPNNYQPTIKFQRGEILNPYPASDVFPRPAQAHPPNRLTPGRSTASCEACSCKHSCFPRN